MPEYRYLHYDVFTDTRFQGNPLAVFPDARGLTDPQMQAIANEMAFSETTFVFPPERDDTDVRMRIFTPAQELPMAGHPTVGTTFALAHDGIVDVGELRLVFGLNVGPTPVDLQWADAALSFAWMTQRIPEFGETFQDEAAREEVAAAVGLEVGALADGVPLQVVSTGVPFLFIPLRSRAAVDRAAPDLALMRRLQQERGVEHYYLFTVEQGEPAATCYSRMFAPVLGIPEDPATGGACGPLGGYLLRHGLVVPAGAQDILNLQGAAMGRPSWIRIQVQGAPDAIQGVRIGGQSVLVATGTLEA